MESEPVIDEAPLSVDETERVDTELLQRKIEALLFVASEALSFKELARLTGASETDVAAAVQKIDEVYAQRGVVLREIAGGYRFASAAEARDVVEAYLLPPKTSLSPAAMETLAIVAYLQPVTKAEIEQLRGVNVDGVIKTLTERRLLVEAGRKDVVGRPILYKTTDEFLEAFGLRSLNDLPPLEEQADGEGLPLTLPLLESADAAPSDSGDEAGDDAGDADGDGGDEEDLRGEGAAHDEDRG
ncbi:MAG TPA: SMC-Scp complex subunit ScpB [Candidatus Dormibacteraeota bacterium]|nr:SMC-Scp complex subunit ScpB [Candidatus Dormibacteraeota bacterium]